MAKVGKKHSKHQGLLTNKEKFFHVRIKLCDTGETFSLRKIYNEMKIAELKCQAELATGIPTNLQRLSYLDEGELTDHSDVRSNDLVSGATLNLRVWHTWSTLVEAASSNDLERVLSLGVTPDSDYKTPTSEYMYPRVKKIWLAERAFVALYIAAHRGHTKLVTGLISAGADLGACTKSGRTALHVAAARGHGKIVDTLLENGANIDTVDKYGASAMSIAAAYGHKDCERHLFLFRWQQRAKDSTASTKHEMFAHQYHDSAYPVWLKGGEGQIYFTKITPPGEYEGTALNAPRRRMKTPQLPVVAIQSSDGELHETESMRIRREDEEQIQREQVARAAFRRWINKKVALERIERAEKKAQEERSEEQRRVADEEKRLQTEIKEKSYEKWLSDKERSTTLPPTQKNSQKAPAATSSQPIRGKKTDKPRTADDVWRAILRRRAEDGEEGSHQVDYIAMRTDYKLFQKFKTERLPQLIQKY